MTDEAKVKRGEAAWREQREATSRRNVEARKRARAERESSDNYRAARRSAGAKQEAEQVRKLNAEIARGQGGLR